jgi:hypothetical protein
MVSGLNRIFCYFCVFKLRPILGAEGENAPEEKGGKKSMHDF